MIGAGLDPGYVYLSLEVDRRVLPLRRGAGGAASALDNLWQRRVAPVLALSRSHRRPRWRRSVGTGNANSVDSVNFELWPGRYLWGYPFTAIAVAALIGVLLVYERDRIDTRVRFTAPLLGLVCGWLQPWQGATAIVILLVAEAIHYRRRPGNVSLLVLTVVATGAPLLYYVYMSRKDASWELFTTLNRGDLYSWFAVAAAIGLLGVPAVLAYRHVGDTFQAVAVRVWPVAAIAVYAAMGITNKGTLPGHALQGLTVPLAVLAVVGFATVQFDLPRVALAGLVLVLVGVLVVPGILRELHDARAVVTNANSPFFVKDNEHDALEYLADKDEPGGVIAPVALGQVVPGLTARNTWVGLPSWTPDYALRVGVVDLLFSGKFGAAGGPAGRRRQRRPFRALGLCPSRRRPRRRIAPDPDLHAALRLRDRLRGRAQGTASCCEGAMTETRRWFFVHVQKTAGTASGGDSNNSSRRTPCTRGRATATRRAAPCRSITSSTVGVRAASRSAS